MVRIVKSLSELVHNIASTLYFFLSPGEKLVEPIIESLLLVKHFMELAMLKDHTLCLLNV